MTRTNSTARYRSKPERFSRSSFFVWNDTTACCQSSRTKIHDMRYSWVACSFNDRDNFFVNDGKLKNTEVTAIENSYRQRIDRGVGCQVKNPRGSDLGGNRCVGSMQSVIFWGHRYDSVSRFCNEATIQTIRVGESPRGALLTL